MLYWCFYQLILVSHGFIVDQINSKVNTHQSLHNIKLLNKNIVFIANLLQVNRNSFIMKFLLHICIINHNKLSKTFGS